MQNFLGVQTVSIRVPNRVTDDICGPTPAAQGIISPMESFNLVFPPSLRRQIFSSTSQITTGKICIVYSELLGDFMILIYIFIMVSDHCAQKISVYIRTCKLRVSQLKFCKQK